MTYLIGDGFDLYSSPLDAVSGNQWTSSSGSYGATLSTLTRFAVGRSINVNGGQWISKTGAINQPTWYLHASFMQTQPITTTTHGQYISLMDGATAQCSIVWDYDGNILLTSGGPSGTILATYTSAFVANSFDSYQFKVIINNTTGEFHVRKNGAGSDSFAATGLNTRGGTSNNYANSLQFGCFTTTGSTPNFYVDDFFACMDDGVAPNGWTGDIRAIQLQPLTDTAQKQFTQNSTGSLAFSTTTGAAVRSNSANSLYTFTGFSGGGVVATQGGLLTTASVTFNAGFTGHAKLAVYLLDGDTSDNLSDSFPGTLIGVSAEITNPTSTQIFTFSSVPIKKGFKYCYAVLTDAAFSAVGPNLYNNVYTTGISYVGGFPASLVGVAATTTNNFSGFCQVTATLTANNAGCTSDEAQDGTTTYLSDNNVGDFDLSNLESLNYTPSSILGLTLRSVVAKSNSGARGFEIAGKSGATAFVTAEYSPLTTFSNYGVFYATDPHTSAAWLVAAVNALQIGPKVSS